MTLLASYEALLVLSQQMEKLALQQAWDALGEIETQRAALIAGLPAALTARPHAEQQAIATCIRQIQACDQRVREYVEPWQEQAGNLLARLGKTSE